MRFHWIVMMVAAMMAGCGNLPKVVPESDAVAWGVEVDGAREQYAAALDLLSKGQQKQAEELMSAACNAYPQSQRLWYLQAVLECSRFEFSASVDSFLKVRALNPETLPGRVAEFATQKEGSAVEGFARLKALIEAHPDEMEARWFFAMESTRQRIDLEEGKQQFQEILKRWKIAPVMVHQTYATLLTNWMEQPAEALEHAQLAAELEPGALSYQSLAFTLYRTKQFEASDQVYGKLLEMEPENSIFWFQWGNCLAQMKKYAAAAEKFEKAYETRTTDAVALVCWGRCLEHQGKAEEAFGKYQEARQLGGVGGMADSYIAIAKLYGYGTDCDFEGALEMNVGKGRPAIGLLREQIENASLSDNPLAPEQPAVLLEQLKKKAEGNDPDAQYSLAMMYRHGIGVKKDSAASKEWLKRATENGHEIALRAVANEAAKSSGSIPKAFLGTWTSDDSIAVYEITRGADGVKIRGYSAQSGREMVVDAVEWDGEWLRFTTYMPATDHKVRHENRLLNAKTMESNIFMNKVYKKIYKKQKPES